MEELNDDIRALELEGIATRIDSIKLERWLCCSIETFSRVVEAELVWQRARHPKDKGEDCCWTWCVICPALEHTRWL